MKKIKLSGVRGKGMVALVDDEDYQRLSEFRWNLHSAGYAVSGIKISGKKICLYMHRMVMDNPKNVVDHINFDKLDNRKINLRECTQQENCWNSSPVGGRAFKGVSLDKRNKKWKSYIRSEDRQVFLGYFKTEEEAAKAYDRGARKFFGVFARLNFPDIIQ